MVKLIITITLLTILVMGALLTFTMFNKRDAHLNQTQLYDDTHQKTN